MRSLFSLMVCLVALCLPSLAEEGVSSADKSAKSNSPPPAATQEEVQQLRSEVASQKQTIEELKAMVGQLAQRLGGDSKLVNVVGVQAGSNQPAAPGGNPAQRQEPEQAAKSGPAIERLPGREVKFAVAGGQFQIYGHGDVSFDYVDNGLANRVGAVGNNGWLSQLSSNLSYFGVRGSRRIVPDLNGIFQIETEVAFTSNPGPTSDAQVKQGFGSRDTYVGLQGDRWGAIKLGREDAPYKRTVSRLDPFVNSIGDNRSIMGNSGGDNRAEFKTRLSHAVWYETPTVHGFWASVLFSPGQNRASDNSLLARAEPNCSGGNDAPCTDGSWGNVMSAAVTYTHGPLYLITAYEHHGKVNRIGDEGGSAVAGVPPAGSVGIADESAFEAGVQFNVKSSGTTLNFLYENLKRYAPAMPAFNERTRPLATWISVVQKVSPTDDFDFGWAHAGRTPGDPGGQVNQPGCCLNLAGPIDNRSNLFDAGYKHHFTDRVSGYFVFARQMNHRGAHYDLGANGHGAVVDRLDAAGTSFTGLTHQGVSGGMIYDF